MFCAKCGKEAEDNIKFCSSCGNQLAGDPEEIKPSATTSTDFNEETSVSVSKSKVKKVILPIIGLIVGALLVFWVYSSKNTSTDYSAQVTTPVIESESNATPQLEGAVKTQTQEDEEREYLKQMSALKKEQEELEIQRQEAEKERLKAKADLDAAIENDRVKGLAEEAAIASKKADENIQETSKLDITTQEQPIKVSIGTKYESGWHQRVRYLYIQSIANNLIIENIELNRGNCQNVQTVPAYSPKFPIPPLNYGSQLQVILMMGSATFCNLLETKIQTNQGTFNFTFE
jgi:hypothetical protein